MGQEMDRPAPGMPCHSCGAEAWEYRTFGRWASARSWLSDGHLPQAYWVCGECGNSAGVPLLLQSFHWWGAPKRVLDVFRRRRSNEPSPAMYVGAAVVGSIVGAVFDVLAGWPWWAFTAGFLVLTWCFFMSSMFWGVHGTGPLRRELRIALTGRWFPRNSISGDP